MPEREDCVLAIDRFTRLGLAKQGVDALQRVLGWEAARCVLEDLGEVADQHAPQVRTRMLRLQATQIGLAEMSLHA